VGFQLRRAHTLFALHWQLSFRGRKLRVTPMQGGMLLTIASRPGLTQAALARLMEVEGPTLMQALDRLQESGLVRRVRHEHDRRSYALQLTPQGRTVLAQVKRLVPQREDKLLADLSPEERALLLDLLQRVVRRSQNEIALAQAETPRRRARTQEPTPATRESRDEALLLR
jgi:DNA-binding MarR family transcriptional regulator